MEGKFNIFAVIAKRMDWLSQRQRVLAQNIANSDTPHYAPRDLNETDFQRALSPGLRPVAPTSTHPRHLAGTAAQGGPARSQVDKAPYEASPVGNAVVLEEQAIKVARTQSDYQTMTSLYRKHMDMFRTALRGGGG